MTVLLARDAGPFDAFKAARKHVKPLGCPYCVSVWIGAALQSLYFFTVFKDTPTVAACSALALSAVAVILDRCFSSDYTA